MFREIVCEGMQWIKLAGDRHRWMTVVNRVLFQNSPGDTRRLASNLAENERAICRIQVQALPQHQPAR
jgi:hypothetical protein